MVQWIQENPQKPMEFRKTGVVSIGTKDKWEWMLWITESGLGNFLRYPELAAIDEAYPKKVKNLPRSLFQWAGWKGSQRSYVAFRALFDGKPDAAPPLWMLSVGIPFIVSQHVPAHQQRILEMVGVILIDAGPLQLPGISRFNVPVSLAAFRAVTKENNTVPVFTRAALRICYWHQIPQKLEKKILAGTSSARRQWLVDHLTPRLENIFTRAETESEQFAAWGELFGFLAPAEVQLVLGKELHKKVCSER